MTPLVKICGLTNVDDAVMSFDCGADMLGLIFAKSPRQISLAMADSIVSKLSGKIKLVGVFDNPDDSRIQEVCDRIELDKLQLYFSPGDKVNNNYRLPILRSYLIQNRADLQEIDVSGALLDLKHAPELFNFISIESGLPDMKQAILAGGLNSMNIDAVIENFKPLGVDTARGVERSPGNKDKRKLEIFIRKVKSWTYPIV